MNANNTQVKNDARVHRSNTYVFKNTNGDTEAPDFVEESDDEDQSDDGLKDGSPKVNDLDSCGDDSDLLKQKKDYAGNDDKSNQSLKYPPGFTPNEGADGSNMNMGDSRNDNSDKIHEYNMAEGNSVHNGEDMVKSRAANSYRMDGVSTNDTEIIESQGAKDEFSGVTRDKMENMEIFSVKMCWGNYAFDYIYSDSVGNSGGNDMLIVAVYAPYDLRDKQILSDRFGSVFNAQGASMFNSFIANAGLEEVPLGGSSFTWCHKSATKMSKLVRS
ncbi:hypothetical protein Tco_0291522 [Tanacetum coccineum]